MTRQILVNNNGTWAPAKKVHVKDGGVWHEAKRVWVNENGIWKIAHPNWVEVTFTLRGAPGGAHLSSANLPLQQPGGGGSVTYTARITRGTTISVYPATMGEDTTYNCVGGGGGGASAIFIGTELLAIAGGGGGATRCSTGGDAGAIGSNGGYYGSLSNTCGKGGSLTADGAGGKSADNGGHASSNGNAGSLNNGGNGGSSTPNSSKFASGGYGYGIGGKGLFDDLDGGGAGGGAGYYAGGGGAATWNSDSTDRGGGGGGGTNWAKTTSGIHHTYISSNINNPNGINTWSNFGIINISYNDGSGIVSTNYVNKNIANQPLNVIYTFTVPN